MRYKRESVRRKLDTMEEGPVPLRDAKPAEKVKTGVELFRDSNQFYVVSDTSIDAVQRVNEHNSTYPKMKDELDKRHSISKATVFSRDIGICTPKFRSHSKRKSSRAKYERRRKNTRKNKAKRGVDKRTKTRTRTRKARNFSSKKTFKMCTCRLNVGCQCPNLKKARNRMSGTDDILTFDLSIPKSTNFAPMDVFVKSQSIIQPKSSKHGGSIKSLYRKNVEDDTSNNSNYGIASIENPDTSDPSISSYNSFASSYHEPLV